MKRLKLYSFIIGAAALTLAGCSSAANEESAQLFEKQTETETATGTEEQVSNESQAEPATETQETVETEPFDEVEGNAETTTEADTSASSNGEVSICDETTELDYSKDYTDEIKVAVERAVASASSLEDEFAKMDEIHECITARRSQDQTQAEMSMASYFYYQVWDAELNNLWSRVSEAVDADTKDRLLKAQRNWIAMKDEATVMALGPREEGGSIYPMLVNEFIEDSTKNRCYLLAKELAAVTGDSYEMPKKDLRGMYLDNQGTDSICSSISIMEGWESGYTAKISLYRIGELDGTVTEDGDGKLAFVSDDESVKGTILYGWDGASLEITQADGASIVATGDKFEFPVTY